MNSKNIDEASALFSGVFGSVLNKHAPMKVFQVRNNYVPWMSDLTKKMIAARDELKKEAIDEDCPEKFEAYKRLRNKIGPQLERDKLEHYRDKFYQDNPSTSTLWKNVNDYLNTSNRSFSNTPNIIIHDNKTHTKPRDIANALNDAFLLKVKKLKEKTSNFVSKDPIERLCEFLNKQNTEIEEFEIKKNN